MCVILASLIRQHVSLTLISLRRTHSHTQSVRPHLFTNNFVFAFVCSATRTTTHHKPFVDCSTVLHTAIYDDDRPHPNGETNNKKGIVWPTAKCTESSTRRTYVGFVGKDVYRFYPNQKCQLHIAGRPIRRISFVNLMETGEMNAFALLSFCREYRRFGIQRHRYRSTY